MHRYYLIALAALMTSAAHATTVRTTAELSSATAKIGDIVPLDTPDITATVIDVQKRGGWARSGRLTIAVGATTYTASPKATTGAKIMSVGVGGAFIKGKHAVIPTGTEITLP